MYYKEEVINGVLCWKGTPGGEWIPFTPEQLTKRLMVVSDLRIKELEEE
jgi:hypothetical protein